jgi:hypothetical protein
MARLVFWDVITKVVAGHVDRVANSLTVQVLVLETQLAQQMVPCA